MARPLPNIPHPSSALVEQVGDLFAITREWFRKLTEALDLIPVSGTVTFAAATSAAVTFDRPERDANYNVLFEAPEDRRVWVTAKATTGFTVNVSSASSATYGWTIARR